MQPKHCVCIQCMNIRIYSYIHKYYVQYIFQVPHSLNIRCTRFPYLFICLLDMTNGCLHLTTYIYIYTYKKYIFDIYSHDDDDDIQHSWMAYEPRANIYIYQMKYSRTHTHTRTNNSWFTWKTQLKVKYLYAHYVYSFRFSLLYIYRFILGRKRKGDEFWKGKTKQQKQTKFSKYFIFHFVSYQIKNKNTRLLAVEKQKIVARPN